MGKVDSQSVGQPNATAKTAEGFAATGTMAWPSVATSGGAAYSMPHAGVAQVLAAEKSAGGGTRS